MNIQQQNPRTGKAGTALCASAQGNRPQQAGDGGRFTCARRTQHGAVTGNEFVEVDSNRDTFGTRQPSDHHLPAILCAVDDRKVFFRHEVDFILDVRIPDEVGQPEEA